jgi:hypothetical protein
MHNDFPEWYRSVTIDPNSELLANRWKGIETWCSEISENPDLVYDTIRLFLGSGSPTSEFKSRFTRCFKEVDSTFPQRNDHEIRVLAGASIANCFSDQDFDAQGVTFALALKSATFVTKTSSHPFAIEILKLAESYLNQKSDSLRDHEALNRDDIDPNGRLKELIDVFQTDEAPDPAKLKAMLLPILHELQSDSQNLRSAYSSLLRDQLCTDEECNILWWLEGQCSRDLRLPWISVESNSVPLIAAKELAELIEILPGPIYAQAFLHRVNTLAGTKKVNFFNAVNALTPEWINSCLKKTTTDYNYDITPIWSALQHRAKTPNDESWQDYFSSVSGIDPSRLFDASDLASQMYVESLLLKSLEREE